MEEYKYQKQERFNWCTIACMSMIYECYGIIKSQDSIYCDMVTASSLDNNGWIPLQSAVNHINRKSFLSSCMIKVANPDLLFDFVADNNISMIMVHRARFADSYHSTLFERKENELIYGIDPDNEDLFPIKKDELKELWKDNWYLKTDGNAILISNNNDIFSESAATCGHIFKVINIPANIAEFVLCPSCGTWRRITKMNPDNEMKKRECELEYTFTNKFMKELNLKFGVDNEFVEVNKFIRRMVSKINSLLFESQKETGVNLPLLGFNENEKLADYEWALLMRGYCIEKFTIDINTVSVEEIETKIIECFKRNIPAIVKAFR